ncbi:MAG TPA: FecR family protein [Allosphingosinicella sp.]|nr:FecR family protein [Allosphingosinicella sp.]
MRPGPLGKAAAAVAAASLAASPAFAQAVGVNAAVRNKVVIVGAGTKKARPAVVRERVNLNDEVRTAAASQLQILLLDRTTFTVGANARVAVDRFVYDPARNSRSTGVSVTRGAFRFMSGRTLRSPSGPVSVRTPVATIGIRGTIFEGVVGEDAIEIAEREPAVGRKVKSKKDEASLIVLRGPGPRTQGDTRPGAVDVTVGASVVTLDRPGLALYAPRVGAPPIGPFPISAAGLQALQSLLRTTAEPGGGGGKKGNGTRDALLGAAAVGAVIGGAMLLGGKKKGESQQQQQQQDKKKDDQQSDPNKPDKP